MTTFATIPTIETERLILRGFREDDFPRLKQIENDLEMTKFTGGILSEDQAWRFMATMIGHWTLRGFGPFALEEKATIRFAYDDLGWTTIASCIMSENLASQAVSKRLGAVKEKTDMPFGDLLIDVWRHLPPQQFKDLH